MTMAPRRWYLSVCGLDCSGCPIHLRAQEELDYWRAQKADLGRVRCSCCRSERKEGEHWAWDCGLVQCCVDQKGLEFCAQCEELERCRLVAEFVEQADHHRAAFGRLREMRRVGVESWLKAHGCA